MLRFGRLILKRNCRLSICNNIKEVLIKRSYCNSYSQSKDMADPNTLRESGYAFNNAGQLRKLDSNGEITDEPFQFNVSDQHQECQAHYEKIGDMVTNYVYHLLETEQNLVRLPVPKESNLGNGTFIFVSKDYDKKEKLMVLIHGSGAVRAGQWARSLIINNNLDMGSQIPYIKKAVAEDFGVIILNGNDNCQLNGKKIPYSSTPEEHSSYVWETYIERTKASSIVIVAHSYGGLVTVMLSEKMKEDFEKRVKAVAFTDSVHGFSNHKLSNYLKQVAKNWVASSTPLDTPLKTPESDITRVSAGHQHHEMTSYSCIESVFKFINKKIKN